MMACDGLSRVLCVSHDELLLETRQLVLASRYQAVSVRGIEEMEALDENFDAVLLCHTLSAEECGRATKIAQRRWPKAKMVAISTAEMSCVSFADQVVWAQDGPR